MLAGQALGSEPPRHPKGEILRRDVPGDTSLLCASQGMAQGARAVSPEHKAASAPVFLVAVEGTVSARDLCHTPALSAM